MVTCRTGPGKNATLHGLQAARRGPATFQEEEIWAVKQAKEIPGDKMNRREPPGLKEQFLGLVWIH